MRRLMPFGAAALLALVVSATPEFSAQDQTYLLQEMLGAGSVRTVDGRHAMDVTLTLAPGTNYAVTTTTEFEKSFHIEEWVRAVADGRVTEVQRSYGDMPTESVSVSDLGQGPQKVKTPGVDPKAHQSFVMKVRRDGTREITHDTHLSILEKEMATIPRDTEPDLLPGRKVKIGESWKVPGGKLGLIGMASGQDVMKSADVTATLKSVTRNEQAQSVATISVSGTVHYETFVASGVGADFDTHVFSEVSFKGNAYFNLTYSLMAGFEWEGTSQASGKMNGSTIAATTTYSEAAQYGYAQVFDEAPDNGKHGPDAAAKLETFPSGAIDPAHVVIARNDGKIARFQVFDPATKKIVKTLLVMPGASSIQNLALSPDRKRLAFSSSLNQYISLARADVFVLEIETGKLNQVTPHWATGDGVAKALDTGKTATLTGRIIWKDTDPAVNRDRHDGFSGLVRVDHTMCNGKVNADGTFEVKGVPVGTALLISISGMLPSYVNGKPRPALEKFGGTTMVETIADENGKNLGDVRISPNHIDNSYDRPCWQGDALLVNLSGWTQSYRVGYPDHTWQAVDYGAQLQMLAGGFSASPDGKLVAFCHDSSGGEGSVSMFSGTGKLLWQQGVPGTTLSFTAESIWTPEGMWLCTAGVQNTLGKSLFGSPALVVALPEQKQAGRIKAWAQLAGHRVLSLTTDGENGFFVTHQTLIERNANLGDLWMWEPESDTLTRMTSLHDLVGVASYGR
ncbi:MAG: hypothetical protein K8I27_15085 [Planctomycetes bacterium]|nr:hypothetical protein [Planctomycetota bacterium]